MTDSEEQKKRIKILKEELERRKLKTKPEEKKQPAQAIPSSPVVPAWSQLKQIDNAVINFGAKLFGGAARNKDSGKDLPPQKPKAPSAPVVIPIPSPPAQAAPPSPRWKFLHQKNPAPVTPPPVTPLIPPAPKKPSAPIPAVQQPAPPPRQKKQGMPEPAAPIPNDEKKPGRQSVVSNLFLHFKAGAAKVRSPIPKPAPSSPMSSAPSGSPPIGLFRAKPKRYVTQGVPEVASQKKMRKKPSKGTMYVAVGFHSKKPRAKRPLQRQVEAVIAPPVEMKSTKGFASILLSRFKRRRRRRKPVKYKAQRRIRITPSMRAQSRNQGVVSLLTFGVVGGGKKKQPYRSSPMRQPPKSPPGARAKNQPEGLLSMLTFGAIGGHGGGKAPPPHRQLPQRQYASVPANKPAVKQSEGLLSMLTFGAIGGNKLPTPKQPPVRQYRPTQPTRLSPANKPAAGKPEGLLSALTLGAVGGGVDASAHNQLRQPPYQYKPAKPMRSAPANKPGAGQSEGLLSMLTFGAIGGANNKPMPYKQPAGRYGPVPAKRPLPKSKPGTDQQEGLLSALTLGAVGGGGYEKLPQHKQQPSRQYNTVPAKRPIGNQSESLLSMLTFGAIGAAGGTKPKPQRQTPAPRHKPFPPMKPLPMKKPSSGGAEGLLSALTLGAVGGASVAAYGQPPSRQYKPAYIAKLPPAKKPATGQSEGLLSMLTFGAVGGGGNNKPAAAKQPVHQHKPVPSMKPTPAKKPAPSAPTGLLSTLTLGALGGGKGRPGSPMAQSAQRAPPVNVLPTYTSSMQSEINRASRHVAPKLPPTLIMRPANVTAGGIVTISAIGHPVTDTVELSVDGEIVASGTGMVSYSFVMEQPVKSHEIKARDVKNNQKTTKALPEGSSILETAPAEKADKAPQEKPSSIETTFTVRGLPRGTIWTVRYDDQGKNAPSPDGIAFIAEPGKHQFSINDVVIDWATYVPIPASGDMDAGESVSISFSKVQKSARPAEEPSPPPQEPQPIQAAPQPPEVAHEEAEAEAAQAEEENPPAPPAPKPQSALPPTLIVRPGSVVAGGIVTMSTIGHPMTDTVEIMVDDVVKASGTGTVSYMFTAEQSAKSYAITARDTNNGEIAGKVVEVKPSARELIFIEQGLPPGVKWSVRYGDQIGSAISPRPIKISSEPGDHPLLVHNVVVGHDTYTTSPVSGAFDDGEKITVEFSKFSPAERFAKKFDTSPKPPAANGDTGPASAASPEQNREAQEGNYPTEQHSAERPDVEGASEGEIKADKGNGDIKDGGDGQP